MRIMLHNKKLMLFVIFVLFLSNTGTILGAKDADQASKIYDDFSKSVLMIIIKSEKGDVIGQGTGFVVAGGKVITNEHVVRNGSVFIDLGAVKLPASVVRLDAFNDIALLSVGAELILKPLNIGDVLPTPGSSVYAIGNPAGLERSISAGIVSGVRDLNGRQLLQITAPISPGSSGGPILNARGEVVGVAVGMLEKGQNLNFAVPAAHVRKLLSGEVQQASADVLALLNKVDNLRQKRDPYEYSSETDSDWQKINRQIDLVLENALANAGTEPSLLLKIAEQAEWQNINIAFMAAERAVQAKSTAEANLMLGKVLKIKTLLAKDDEKPILRGHAEKTLRTALRLSKQPSAAIHYHLADILEDRSIYSESENNFRRALDLSKKSGDTTLQTDSLRGLVRTTYALGKQSESDTWFKAIVDTGMVTAWDWEQNGHRLEKVKKYPEAAQSFLQAGLLGGMWTNWCEAASSFADVDDDAMLTSARKCISAGSGKKDSEKWLAAANHQIAYVLNARGVYQEALSHARESTVLNPSNAWAFNIQAEALLGLRRFQEAINASNQAIRLSDGKYGMMHFNLGSAYFGVENWVSAKNSFEKAAQLNPKDDASAYNVALCNVRLGYYRDAADWYEEVLRRNPTHRNRQTILADIQRLRR